MVHFPLGLAALLAPLQAGADTGFAPSSRGAALFHDVDSDGQHLARGRTYKAAADDGGFTYVPFLGSEVPTNHPVQFRLSRALRGKRALELAGQAEVSRDGDRLVMDRGAVQVRYDLAAESAEQSFLLAEHGGEGDLTLVLDVTTDLEAAPDGAGLRFSCEFGGVRYGAAKAIDAEGRETPVPVSWSNGEIALTVPSTFLEGAAWPLLVDPLLDTVALDPPAASLGRSDAVYMQWTTPMGYLVVAEEHFSGADTDLYSWIVGLDGMPTAGQYVDMSASSWEKPAIARAGIFSSFIVVAEGDSVAVPGSKDIVARFASSPGNLFPPEVIRSATAEFTCQDPDVGGDSPGDLGYWVVYNRSDGTQRDAYKMSTFIPATEAPLAADPLVDEGPPAISSQTTGVLFDLIVAWPERELATGQSSVEGAILSTNGGGLRPFQVAPPTPGALFFDVAVSLGGPEVGAGGFPYPFLVTYDDRPSNVTDAFVALGRAGDFGTSTPQIVDTIELQITEHVDRAPNQNDVRVATGKDEFMLAYVEGGAVYATTLRTIEDKLAVLERRVRVPGSNALPGSLIAIEEAYGEPELTPGLLLWTEADPAGDRIRGRLATPPTGIDLASTPFCYGTVNSTGARGWIQVLGDRSTDQPHTLEVEQLPSNAFGFFLASRDQAPVPGTGGSFGVLCVRGDIGRFGIFQASASGVASGPLDPAAITQPMGPVPASSGETWSFQSWYRDAVGGAATSNFTNGASVQIL